MVEQLTLFGPLVVQLRLPFEWHGTIGAVQDEDRRDPQVVRRTVAWLSVVSTTTLALMMFSGLFVHGWPAVVIAAVALAIVVPITIRAVRMTSQSLRRQAGLDLK